MKALDYYIVPWDMTGIWKRYERKFHNGRVSTLRSLSSVLKYWSVYFVNMTAVLCRAWACLYALQYRFDAFTLNSFQVPAAYLLWINEGISDIDAKVENIVRTETFSASWC